MEFPGMIDPATWTITVGNLLTFDTALYEAQPIITCRIAKFFVVNIKHIQIIPVGNEFVLDSINGRYF